MKLSLYVARRFLRMFLAVLAIFFGILMMVGTVDQIRDLGGKAGIGAALHLALLNAPASLYRILPLITVLATISLFLALARSSELVVIRAAGRSGLRTLMAPVFTAFLLGVLAVAAFNPIVAATQKQAEVQSDRYNGNDRSRLSVSGEGLWLRQGGPEGQSVIRAARANSDGTRLEDATFLSFGPKGPTKRIAAARAELSNGMWHLSEVKEWSFEDPEANPEATAQRHDTLEIPSDLTAARIRDGFGTPSEISIWNLPAFISGLEDAGFSARRHLVWFQMELALPLLLAAMVMVGAGFTMRHARFGKTGLMVLFAMAAGFAIFFLRNFAQVLGENGQIPVALAAWAPPAAGILFSLGLLLHLEDG